MQYNIGDRIIYITNTGEGWPGVIAAINDDTRNNGNRYRVELDNDTYGWTNASKLKPERMISIEEGGITRA